MYVRISEKMSFEKCEIRNFDVPHESKQQPRSARAAVCSRAPDVNREIFSK